MSSFDDVAAALLEIPGLRVERGAPLSRYTRFGIGGAAAALAGTGEREAFQRALRTVRAAGARHAVIGGGTNLIVSDAGFDGIVLRFTGNRISRSGGLVTAESGAGLQELVEYANEAGLRGLETLAGIPGWVGAAIYGNAGAYGHSIAERVEQVRFSDGESERTFSRGECAFRYRESIFKRNKQWIILDAVLRLEPAPREQLRRVSGEILKIRNEKFPPSLKCAGSVFKNLLLAELPPEAAGRVPPQVVREGKVPAAWFLEQSGAKQVSRGGIRVAAYHANLIYNAGGGTARELCEVIAELKSRVRRDFGIELEEEVQYVGFGGA